MAGSDRNDGRIAAIPSTGLTTVIEPPDSQIDIVFVHGFKGHPERTWVQKTRRTEPERQEERPSKYRRLGLLSRQAKVDQEVAVFWPRDLIPSIIPNARILTYGYDAKIQHGTGPPVSTHTVYDIAWDFLVALEAERRCDPKRPVLFIAHSLGGIIVKEMLRRASTVPPSQAHLSMVLNSTTSIMFFGTPHGGAEPRGALLKVAEKAYRALGYSANQQIVDSLLPSSERLRELRDAFGPLAETHNWTIHSFQEQYCAKLIDCKVVEDNSSYLNMPAIEITEHIGRDHMGMSRFSGPDDPEFKKVAAALRRMTQLASRRERDEPVSPTHEEVGDLLHSLKFEQIDARHDTIKKAHAKTCRWLLRNSEYVTWLDTTFLKEHHGLFWIKGKPGTGKSTIMKYILGQSKRTMKDRTVLSFFFNARGEELERSTQGLYQSLLLQLLEQRPDLQCVLKPLLSSRGNDTNHFWSIETLKTAFDRAIESSGSTPVTCFIDALDECDISEIRDMVSFFAQVGEKAVTSGNKFLVCLSSRHYPHITIKHGLELVLDGHEGHVQDITDYVDSELKIGHSKLAETIRQELQEKASGVFMWVVLVVSILNEEHDRGRMHALRRRLHELPSDLHELFRDILVRDSHGKEELLLCIQWVLFAKRPLKPEELYYAILSGVDLEAVSARDHSMIDTDDMRRYILDCSKGLTEFTKSKVATVQFIHESVRDFLLKDNSLLDLWPHLCNGFTGHSHEKLKKCCANYLSLLESSKFVPTSDATKIQLDVERRMTFDAFPFLEYAVRSILFHANEAGESNNCQREFLNSFLFERWILQYNVVEKFETRRYKPGTRLLYVLAENDLAHLTRIQFSIQDCVGDGPERYGCPLAASLRARSVRALQELRKALVLSLPLSKESRDLLERTNGPEIQESEKKDYVIAGSRRSILPLLDNNDEDLLSLFICARHYTWSLEMGTGHMLNYLNNVGGLRQAATMGHAVVLKLLLEMCDCNLLINLPSDNEGPLLIEASKLGRHAVVEMILRRQSSKTKPVLTAASMINQTEAEEGDKVITWTPAEAAKATISDSTYLQALGCALSKRHTTTIEVLLKSIRIEPIYEGARSQPLLEDKKIALDDDNDQVIRCLITFGEQRQLKFGPISSSEDPLPRMFATAILTNIGNLLDASVGINKVEIYPSDSKGRALLCRAIYGGYTEEVARLTEMDSVDLEWKELGGFGPLHLACSHGHESIIKVLLQSGRVQPDRKTFSQKTALYIAAIAGNVEAVRLLLKTGQVDPNSVDLSHAELAQRAPCKPWGTFDLGGRDLISHISLEFDEHRQMANVKSWRMSDLIPNPKFGHKEITRLLVTAGAESREIRQ